MTGQKNENLFLEYVFESLLAYLYMGKKGTLRQGKRYDENKYHFFVFLTSLNLFEQKWNGSVTPT